MWPHCAPGGQFSAPTRSPGTFARLPRSVLLSHLTGRHSGSPRYPSGEHMGGSGGDVRPLRKAHRQVRDRQRAVSPPCAGWPPPSPFRGRADRPASPGRQLLRGGAHQPPERPLQPGWSQAAVPTRTRTRPRGPGTGCRRLGAETGAAGDVMLSAALHCFDDSDKPVHLTASEQAFNHGPATPLPTIPAQTTGDLAAIVTDQPEAVVVACALVSEFLADMGAHEPYVLTPKGKSGSTGSRVSGRHCGKSPADELSGPYRRSRGGVGARGRGSRCRRWSVGLRLRAPSPGSVSGSTQIPGCWPVLPFSRPSGDSGPFPAQDRHPAPPRHRHPRFATYACVWTLLPMFCPASARV